MVKLKSVSLRRCHSVTSVMLSVRVAWAKAVRALWSARADDVWVPLGIWAPRIKIFRHHTD